MWAASTVTIRYTPVVDWTNAPQTHEALPTAVSAAPPQPTLSVLYAPDRDRLGQRVILDEARDVGRVVSDFGGVAFDDSQMSRRHATFRPVGDQILVEDGGSTNGTVLNGDFIKRQHLEPGDILQIGETFFGFDRVHPETIEALGDMDLIGVSTELRELAQALRFVAPRLTPVLISGEPGVGKRAVAREVIRLRGRPAPPLTIQCGAGPADQVEESLFGGPLNAAMKTTEVGGAFRAACDGTLVLVDVDQLSLHAQAWLYWTMEELSRSGPLSPPRLIATTSLSVSALEKRVQAGEVRADLFGMLRAWTVEIAPLRRRRQDIPALVGRFVSTFAQGEGETLRALSVDSALMWALIDHDWPRNVDELRSVIEAACVEGAAGDGVLTLTERLQRLIGRGESPRGTQSSLAAPRTRSELLAVLQEHEFVISRVADHFGKHRQQVYRWMERFGIDRRAPKGASARGEET